MFNNEVQTKITAILTLPLEQQLDALSQLYDWTEMRNDEARANNDLCDWDYEELLDDEKLIEVNMDTLRAALKSGDSSC